MNHLHGVQDIASSPTLHRQVHMAQAEAQQFMMFCSIIMTAALPGVIDLGSCGWRHGNKASATAEGHWVQRTDCKQSVE